MRHYLWVFAETFTAVVVGLFLVSLMGCSDTSPTGDAPTGQVDDTPAFVVNMPNTFMNVAFKCMGANGIYAHTREAAPVIVANDPECDG